MKRRLLSILIGLVVLLCAVTVFVYATGEEVTVLSADTGDLVVTTDTYIDLNGHSIDGVTVADGATLYISDSQTDDYTVADGIYGTVTGIAGNVQAADGYMSITEGETLSFHRVALGINTMSLRPGVAGVYYGSHFAGDEMVARQVKNYGIALSVAAVPTELNLDTQCAYTAFTGFAPGANSANGTLLSGILSENNTMEENARNASMPVYGRAYILTDDGYIFGSYVVRDLQTQLEAIDGIWENLTDTQKNALIEMYEKYQPVMEQWELPNLQSTVLTEKFVSKFRGDFLYRVGNQNALSVGSLFAASEGADINSETVNVTVTTQSGTATGTYTAGTTWTAGKLKFSGLGIVNVTVRAAGAIPVTLQLEVVEAVNSTSAANATANNVVLLNDTGFGSVTVKNGYTFYGNGFTMTCGSDSPALDMGYAFVTLENGNLDNVNIICPNFWHASLYKSNLTSEDNETQVEGTRTRYYNARSAVLASGNNTISNSYISGGRAAIYLTAGTTTLDNTTVYGGAAANIHVLSGASGLVMRDVKLIQEPIRATAKDKTIMGMSVVIMSADDMPTVPPVTLEGSLIQYAWIDEEDAQYIPEDTSAIIEEVFAQTAFVHTIDGKPSVNLGFVVCPSDDKSTGALTVNDNRTNQDTAPYDQTVLDIVFVGDVLIYSCTNENGTDPAFLTKPEHVPDYNAAPLHLNYTNVNENRTFTKEYNAVANAWEYKLVVELDAGDCSLDFGKLQVLEQGVAVPYTVTDMDGNEVDISAQIPLTVGNVSYTVTAANGETIRFTAVGTRKEILAPQLIAADYEAGLCVATTAGGTWSGAAPALEGIRIQYYSVAEGNYKTVSLADCTPTAAGQQNGTNNTWFYEAENSDFTLTLTGGQVHSSNNIYAMPVVCNGKLYFVASSSKGLVNSGNTARTVKVSYVFRDNATDEALSFSYTWSVEENEDEQYQYGDFCSGKLTKLEASGNDQGTCLAAGTLITLADGSKRAVEDLRKGDRVLSFDHVTGEITCRDVIIVVRTAQENYRRNTFVFDDGTALATINEHGIFDLDINAYVNIDHRNYGRFIGHRFVSVDSSGKLGVKTLVAVDTEIASGYKYDIVTEGTLNYVAEDTLSVTHVLVGVINTFDFGTGLVYDRDKMQEDIATYGLYTYDEWAQYCDISVFEQYNIPVMKVGISKGLYTRAYIIGLINTYVLDENVQIIR